MLAPVDGKDVFCEWPLTTTTQQSLELLAAAEAVGIRHLIGLQRRLAPGFRYLRDLLLSGYAGKVRSVRLSVTEPACYLRRSREVAFTIPSENFTHVAVTFGGHFMDALFTAVGWPQEFSAILLNQFTHITIAETDEVIASDAPNELILSGILPGNVALTLHVEGGKRNGFGMQLDITGTEGDLRMSNSAAFHNREDNRIEGAQGEGRPLEPMPVPAEYHWLPASGMPASALELANVYTGWLADRNDGGTRTPTFADAVRLHRLLDLIASSSTTGQRVKWEP